MPPTIQRKGMLLIISGPSGAGKGTLIQQLSKNNPEYVFSCSVTTREPREGEINGVHYHFITQQEYDRLLAEDAFLEHAHVHNGNYGTLRKPVEQALEEGKIMVLDIDCQGALNVMDIADDYVSVFILPESYTALEKRLRARGTETEEQVQTRMNNARIEVPKAPLYQYNIINYEGRQDEAVAQLKAIVDAEKNRVNRNHITIQED
ncbi:MAG: guanylate kinase [Clostridiales bacterium]|nr:guanylate kinase [Clostridiales bacterium]